MKRDFFKGKSLHVRAELVCDSTIAGMMTVEGIDILMILAIRFRNSRRDIAQIYNLQIALRDTIIRSILFVYLL